jgi:hemin uptake protein HemP
MKTPPTPFKPLPPTDLQSKRLPVSSEQLLRGATTLEIDHAGQRYLLRVTRENKLILTK